ncbi:MAG: alpha-galactosidase [Chloroflexota bacterium]
MTQRLNLNGRDVRLGNGITEFIYHGVAARFDIVDRRAGSRILSGGLAQVELMDGERFELTGDEVGHESAFHDAVGSGRQVDLVGTRGDQGLLVGLRIRCHDGRPGLMLQVCFQNRRQTPVRVARLVPLLVNGAAQGSIGLPVPASSSEPFASASVWTNGWQSWSPTAGYPLNCRDTNPLLRFIRVMQTNPTTRKYRLARRYVGEWLAGLVDRTNDQSLVFGFATMKDYLAQVRIDADRTWRVDAGCDCEGVEVAPGGQLASEWLYVDHGVGLEQVLGRYADVAGRLTAARVPASVPTGWCSWYHYFTKVSEADILENLGQLRALSETLPLEYVQVDDGYQTAIGDWTDINAKFPHGMKWLAERIHDAGFKAGIWLAPFTVLPNSRLFRDHPDWLLREDSGRLAYGGYNPGWRGTLYGLDTSHPDVQAWLRQLFRTVTEDWGYDYVKLDFLYCAALPGRRRDGLTRAQALRRGLEIIRETVGERFILGCGCPLGPAIGVVDGMRIGPDVAPDWGAKPLPWERGIPSARNALRNVLNRSFMHRRFWLNDPDCLIVRSRESRLTTDEVTTLAAAIALSGGMLILSDRMASLSPDRLRLIGQTTPASGVAARAVGLGNADTPVAYVLPAEAEWGSWLVAGFFNWGQTIADYAYGLAELGLDPDGEYHLYDFLNGRYLGRCSAALAVRSIPPHGCRLFRLTPLGPGPTIVGSTLHITQGVAEVRSVAVARDALTIELGPHTDGQLVCWFPGDGEGEIVTTDIPAGGPATVVVRSQRREGDAK